MPLAPTLGRSPLARFLAVGVANTGLSFAVFRGMLAALPRVAGAPAVAQATATVLAMLLSYLLNRVWTFGSVAPRGAEVARFVAGQGAYLALSSLVLELAITARQLPATPSWVATTGAMTVVNHLIQRHWVFRDRRRAPAPR